MTEVIYVVSPDYTLQLFNSIRSLLLSGSSFDKITILCVGQKPTYWEFKDKRIIVEEVINISQGFFLINKVHALSRKSDRIIFLDTDTIVLRSIDKVYEGVESEFIGRPDSLLFSRSECSEKWSNIIKKENCRNIPYFNSGFYIFQNASHLNLFEKWKETTRKLYNDNFTADHLHGLKPHPKEISLKYCEQIALSIILGQSSLTYTCMRNQEHAYGWEKESDDNVIVYHTGGPNYNELSNKLQFKNDLFGSSEPRLKKWVTPINYARGLNYCRFKLSQLKIP